MDKYLLGAQVGAEQMIVALIVSLALPLTPQVTLLSPLYEEYQLKLNMIGSRLRTQLKIQLHVPSDLGRSGTAGENSERSVIKAVKSEAFGR